MALCVALNLCDLQRGFIGRYPLHFHKMGDCPECEFIGNAVVGSTQRGIVLHSTHNSKVIRNVVLGAKGAHLYVEEGTELNNTIQVSNCICMTGRHCGMQHAPSETSRKLVRPCCLSRIWPH